MSIEVYFDENLDGITTLLLKLTKSPGQINSSKYCFKLTKDMEIDGHKFRNSSKAGKKIIM